MGSVVDNARDIARRAWADFRKFTPGQKAATIAAALALVVGAVLLASWKSTPAYAPLYTNLAPSDASAIIDKLNASGVPYQLGSAGTEILVPQDKVYATRLTVSAAGLPSSTDSGYTLLDKQGVTASQFQQQVAYQVGLESELSKTIGALNGVTSASVHLAIPQQNVFNDGSQKPTASVLLSTTAGTTLSSSQVQSVVYLVSSSVPGLTADNVTVADANGDVLSAPGSGLTSAAAATTQTQVTQQYDTQLATQLQDMIDRAIGPGRAVVNVNASLDFSKTSVTSQNYVTNPSAPPLSQQTTSETYSGTNSGASGVLGSTTAAGSSGNGKYTKTSNTVNNALGTVSKTVENAPGQVQKLAIAVLVDKSAKNLNVPAITQLVRSGVGFNAGRGDTLSVQALAFDTSLQQAATQAANQAAKQAAASAASKHLAGLIKQGALAALVLALAIGTWLSSRRRRSRALPPEPDDDLFDLDAPPPAPAPARLSPAAMDLNEVAARRQTLADVADNRPADVAHVLSSWLNVKES